MPFVAKKSSAAEDPIIRNPPPPQHQIDANHGQNRLPTPPIRLVFPLLTVFIVSAGAVYVGMVFVRREAVQNELVWYVCLFCVLVIFYAPT